MKSEEALQIPSMEIIMNVILKDSKHKKAISYFINLFMQYLVLPFSMGGGAIVGYVTSAPTFFGIAFIPLLPVFVVLTIAGMVVAAVCATVKTIHMFYA